MQAIRLDHPAPGVARITLARPSAVNAFDAVMGEQMAVAMDAAAGDPSVRAVIITGEGRDFSAGGDISTLREKTAEELAEYHRGLLRLVRAIALCPKPTIAAVRGACAGGALGFALCCDYLIASHSACFSARFLRIGLVPDMGLGLLLAHRVGVHRARRVFLDDRVIPAEEARDIGLCDIVHADGALDGEALGLAGRLADLPSMAVARTKWLMGHVASDLEAFLEAEAEAVAPCFGSDEFQEGTAAFLAKRRPCFR